jgi:MFS family permease
VILPPAFRHRRFTLLWLGLLISVAGSQMQVWSLFWHIRTLTDQPIAVSGIGLVRFFPILLFSLIGGLVADLYDRRWIMFITQATMMGSALGLALLTYQGNIQIWHIYALTAVQSVAASFDLPARQSLLPNLVNKDDLPSAFSMMSLAFNIGSIVGPALSGIVIGSMGQAYTYLFNAVSFVAVLGALLLMGPISRNAAISGSGSAAFRSQEPVKDLRSALTAIAEGVRFILSRPIILGSMLLDFFATFFSSANTLLPFVAQDILKVGAVQYGWLSAAQSIGSVTTALVISQRANLRRQGILLLAAVAVFGVATTVFGLARSFVLVMLALIVIGAADTVSTILRNTIRQMQTPDYIRGRMVSINQIFFSGGPQLGEIEAGIVAQAFGTPMAIISGGIGCIAAAGFVAWVWPQLRRYNGDEPIVSN